MGSTDDVVSFKPRRSRSYGRFMRRGDRVAEGGALLRRYTGLNLYRGFESLPLRQIKRTPGGSFLFGARSGGLNRILLLGHEALLPGKTRNLIARFSGG